MNYRAIDYSTHSITRLVDYVGQLNRLMSILPKNAVISIVIYFICVFTTNLFVSIAWHPWAVANETDTLGGSFEVAVAAVSFWSRKQVWA